MLSCWLEFFPTLQLSNAFTIHGFKPEESRMFDLVCIGNPVYDEIITPHIRTEGRVLSGCSTNACLAARKLGVSKVGFVGCIGRDRETDFRQSMDKYGIDARGTKVVS